MMFSTDGLGMKASDGVAVIVGAIVIGMLSALPFFVGYYLSVL